LFKLESLKERSRISYSYGFNILAVNTDTTTTTSLSLRGIKLALVSNTKLLDRFKRLNVSVPNTFRTSITNMF